MKRVPLSPKLEELSTECIPKSVFVYKIFDKMRKRINEHISPIRLQIQTSRNNLTDQYYSVISQQLKQLASSSRKYHILMCFSKTPKNNKSFDSKIKHSQFFNNININKINSLKEKNEVKGLLTHSGSLPLIKNSPKKDDDSHKYIINNKNSLGNLYKKIRIIKNIEKEKYNDLPSGSFLHDAKMFEQINEVLSKEVIDIDKYYNEINYTFFENKHYNQIFDLNLETLGKKEILNFKFTLNGIGLFFTSCSDIKNEQAIYLPFEYIIFFNFLEYDLFKYFISYIIGYDEKFSKFYIKNRTSESLKDFICYIKNNKKTKNATYYLNEKNYKYIYDWCIIYDENDKEKNKSYKFKIILPEIVVLLKKYNIEIRKNLDKDMALKIIFNKFNDTLKYILYYTFIIKDFRKIINDLQLNKIELYENKNINLNIDYQLNNKEDLFEFFLTNYYEGFTNYYKLNTIKITIIKNNDIFVPQKIEVNYNDTKYILKYISYFGLSNILQKCMNIEKNKISFDFTILKNSTPIYLENEGKNKLIKFINSKKETIINLENNKFLIRAPFLSEIFLKFKEFTNYTYKLPLQFINNLINDKKDNLLETGNLILKLDAFNINLNTTKKLIKVSSNKLKTPKNLIKDNSTNLLNEKFFIKLLNIKKSE